MFGTGTTFGSSGAFGSSSASPFGAAKPTGGLTFGSTAPAFGATTGAAGFGSTTGGTSLFGGASKPTFGASPAPAFGASPTTAFGAAPAAAPAFGAAPAASPFGATNTAFGAARPAFGAAPAASPFGASTAGAGLFGSSTTPAFGAAPAAAPVFGAAPAASPFGASSNAFGAAKPAFGAAGAGASAFGAPAPAPGTGLFGAPAPAPSAFGFGSSGAFGATGQTGTSNYTPVEVQDGATKNRMISISAADPYTQKSFEELRTEDYGKGNKGGGSTAGAFGAAASGTFSSTFGAPAAATGTSPFGGFGAAAPAPAAPAPFSFGAATPAFSAPAPAPGFGVFGTTTPQKPAGFSFGSTPAPAPGASPFGATTSPFGSTTGAFGSTSATGAFSFGATPAPAPGASPFGAAAAPTTSGFSFGAAAPAPATSGFSFGAAAQPAYPTTGPLVGSHNQGVFGPADALGAGGCGLAAKLAAVEARAAGLEIRLGDGARPLLATARGNPEVAAAGDGRAGALYREEAAAAARGVARIYPRGLAARGGGGGGGVAAPWLHANGLAPSGVFSPDTYASSSAKKLQIRPSAHRLGGAGAGAGAGALALRPGVPARIDFSQLADDGGEEETKGGEASPPRDPRVAVSPEGFATPGSAGAGKAPARPTPVRPTPGSAASAGSPARAPEHASPALAAPPPPPASPPAAAAPELSGQGPEAVLCPKLTRPGYTTEPPLAELAAMGAAALAALPAFAVARRGVGAVRWEGGVDVRGLDLDALVAIEDRAVAVYEGVAEEEKPPRGRGLNRPALVTLEGVAPPAGANGAKFAAKVERRTRKMGAEFVVYDVERGVWRFRTQHF